MKMSDVKLNNLEQKIYDKYTRVRGGLNQSLFFESGVRHIRFGPDGFEDEKHADFYRRCLAKGLANMINELDVHIDV